MELPSFDFKRSLHEERERLVRLCVLFCGASAPAEDLAQELLFEAWRARAALRDPAQYREWLSGIARNICRRWQRCESRAM